MRIAIVVVLMFLGSGIVVRVGNESLIGVYGGLTIVVPLAMILRRLTAGGIGAVALDPRRPRRRRWTWP